MQVRRSEQKRGSRDPASGVDSSSRHSGTGQDSGFGSDSAHIRIVQIEQQSGASHHCIARPSHKSTITKNLSFIPFDIFLTASRLSVMTYACSSPPKPLPSSSDTTSTPEKKEPGDKVRKRKACDTRLSHETGPRCLSVVHVFIIVHTKAGFLMWGSYCCVLCTKSKNPPYNLVIIWVVDKTHFIQFKFIRWVMWSMQIWKWKTSGHQPTAVPHKIEKQTHCFRH